MATTTPNYGWTVPTSTDLVKDGATAIETLGDAIDASMNTALGTKKAGMVLLNTTSFSAVSSVSFPNNIFTTTYDDYKIIVKIESSSTNGFLAFRLRASGTDATGADYNYAGAGFHSNGATLTAASETATSSFFAYYSTLSTMTKSMSEITVFNPKLAQFTNLISSTSGGVDISSTGRLVSLPVAGLHKLSTAYDSISLIASAGNITGSMSVFGVAK
jgi:hypothetical protein